jgi:pilus assembly protein CpaC
MKFGENQSAMRTVAARTLLLSAAAALTLAPLLPVVAAEPEKDPVTTSSIGSVKMRFLSLGIGKSVVVDLPRDVKDVLVADPKIANAVIRSPQRHRRRGRPDQRGVFRRRWAADRFLRHRGQA